jgi:TrmH family RNA methyltransferase
MNEPLPCLRRCRVVLVRPSIAANIGATARVMRNMGLDQLVLVAPEADINDRNARQLSTHGEDILENARIVPTIGDALTDCKLVLATSARTGGPYRRQSVGAPDTLMSRALASLHEGPVALVFGPESTGLTNEEVTLAHFLIHIPANPDYQALNLAQAVAICLYELRTAALRADPTPPRVAPGSTWAEQERMFNQLREGLEGIHFLYGDNADTLMHALRHLIGRAQPTRMEIDVLTGLARQLRWAAARLTHAGKPNDAAEL